MRITDKKLRAVIKEVALKEWGSPSGGMRRPGSRQAGSQQYKVGKVEDENREVSPSEAETRFPEAIDAWVEIAPDLFPDLEPNIDMFDNPRDRRAVLLRSSIFFLEDGVLTVAGAAMPQVPLMVWDTGIGDWIDA